MSKYWYLTGLRRWRRRLFTRRLDIELEEKCDVNKITHSTYLSTVYQSPFQRRWRRATPEEIDKMIRGIQYTVVENSAGLSTDTITLHRCLASGNVEISTSGKMSRKEIVDFISSALDQIKLRPHSDGMF